MVRYASEVDVDFVRKSIKAIGQTAIKIDSAAERCVNVLLELIGTRVSYVVQEAVVVMKVRDFLSLLFLLCSIFNHTNYHLGHIPKVPLNIRRRNPNSLRESRRAGRA